MKNIVLFDTPAAHDNLLPISYTRPIADFRIGILTIAEKWQLRADGFSVGKLAVDYLREKFPSGEKENNLYIDASLLPDDSLVEAVLKLPSGSALKKDGVVIAFNGSSEGFANERFGKEIEYEKDLRRLTYVYDIFLNNTDEIKADFSLVTDGRKSQPLPDTNLVLGSEGKDGDGLWKGIFIEEGASIPGGVTFNVSAGPIYIGVGAEVMEGSCLRGPFALCRNAKVNMGAKIYPGTTVGPWCKVGGELNNAVMFGYSNKAHDGFLGNAVVGEWCNIGAGTNASNLKNDYTKVRVWNYPKRSFMRTGLQFCGLIMGDHSKAGINCMFNTATVVGVGVNFHGSGFPRPFIPSFQQGSCAGFTDVCPDKFFSIAEVAMARRGVVLTEADRRIFHKIFQLAAQYKG